MNEKFVTVKTFDDGSKVEYSANGDLREVYYIFGTGERIRQTYDTVASELQWLKVKMLGEADNPRRKIYNDVTILYDIVTSDEPSKCHPEVVGTLADSYPGDLKYFADKLFFIIWTMMICDYGYKVNGEQETILKHRAIRLIAYEVLIKGEDPERWTKLVTNTNWKELNEMCKIDDFEYKKEVKE